MYVYVFDDFTNQKKYQRSIHQINKRLTDLGLNGKTIKIEITKNLASSIDDEIRRGAKTIVAVGNDRTTLKTLNAIANSQSDEKHRLSLGIIPLEQKESPLAELLGINNVEDACEILLARRLETLNTAVLGQNFFLFRATTSANDLLLELDKKIVVQPKNGEFVSIINNPTEDLANNKKLILKIKNKESESLFYFNELIASEQKTPIIIDGCLPISLPVKINTNGEKIKIIVGRKRVV